MIIVGSKFDVQVSDYLLQTPYMTAGEINIGWGAILETFEMRSVVFDLLFLFRYQTPNAMQYLCLHSHQGI